MATFTDENGAEHVYDEIGQYREDYRDGQIEITRFFGIPWGEQNTFARIMLGDARIDGQWINRTLPAADPQFSRCFAESAENITNLGAHRDFPDKGGSIFFYDGRSNHPGQAVMQVVFRQPSYDVLSDAEAGNVGQENRELSRFVSWEGQYAGDAVQIGGAGGGAQPFAFVNGTYDGITINDNPPPPLPESATKPIPLVNLKVTWHKVPVLTSAMTSKFGSINLNPITFGSSINPFAAAAELLLYGGAQPGRLQFFPSGNPYRDIELSFVIRPRTWNRIWRRSHRVFQLVSRQGLPNLPPDPGNYPYLPDFLENLFRFP